MEEFKKYIENALTSSENRQWLVERMKEEVPEKRQKRVKYMAYGARQDDDYKHIDYEHFCTPLRDTKDEVREDLINMFKDDLLVNVGDEDDIFYSDRDKEIAKKNDIPYDFIVFEGDEPKLTSEYSVREKLSWLYYLTSVGEYTNPKWKYDIIELEI